jgi:hypothetical protein
MFRSLLLLLCLASVGHAAQITGQFQGTLLLGTPQYVAEGITGNTSENNAAIIIPRFGLLQSCRVRACTSLGALSGVTVTVFQNGAATAMTKTITPADGTNILLITGSLLVNAGDTLSFQVAPTGLSITNAISCSLDYVVF